jgi:hypothetical protein
VILVSDSTPTTNHVSVQQFVLRSLSDCEEDTHYHHDAQRNTSRWQHFRFEVIPKVGQAITPEFPQENGAPIIQRLGEQVFGLRKACLDC